MVRSGRKQGKAHLPREVVAPRRPEIRIFNRTGSGAKDPTPNEEPVQLGDDIVLLYVKKDRRKKNSRKVRSILAIYDGRESVARDLDQRLEQLGFKRTSNYALREIGFNGMHLDIRGRQYSVHEGDPSVSGLKTAFNRDGEHVAEALESLDICKLPNVYGADKRSVTDIVRCLIKQ
tara:strand:+ start:42 stop:569 length:528 start_codon:yes stop_codon:yes gene_type:complete